MVSAACHQFTLDRLSKLFKTSQSWNLVAWVRGTTALLAMFCHYEIGMRQTKQKSILDHLYIQLETESGLVVFGEKRISKHKWPAVQRLMKGGC